jgi:hypothetical protein
VPPFSPSRKYISDRRAHVRRRAGSPAYIEPGEGNRALVLSISESGLALRADRPLTQNPTLRMPTGHGTVGGACITLLKFFFDGGYVWPNPMVPTSDGLSLVPYAGADAGQIIVNGELNKLAHNVSFGHGIHAGIHWRSDTETSMLLGEALALSFLRDKARTYHEKFAVQLAKLDGSIATISNE